MTPTLAAGFLPATPSPARSILFGLCRRILGRILGRNLGRGA